MERLQTIKNKILAQIPDRFSRYKETYGVLPRAEFGVKDVYRNGIHIHQAPISELWFKHPKRWVEPEATPPFARGKCVEISDGDYKTVMIDEGGNSDKVIKVFSFANVYRGEDARENAEEAARRIAGIYRVIDQTTGFHILPNRVFADQYSIARPDIYAVFEVQQRGIFVDHWSVLSPKEAQRVDRDIKKGYDRYTEVTKPELLRQGLVTPSAFLPSDIKDHLLLYVAWDMVTNQLVAKDVVDAVFV